MNNSLQIFSKDNFTVRAIQDENGKVWFVARDVAQALEYTESSVNNAINSLMQSVPDIWKGKKRIFTLGGEQEMLCLTEEGLYFFLGRSDKPKALPYQMWIAGDVVPSIRQTGNYSSHSQDNELTGGIMDGAQRVFEAAGIKGNQLALAMDKIYRRYTGHSALQTGCIELPAPEQKQLLTPTEIGKHFNLKAHRINEILAGAGFQYKINGKWEAIGDGLNHSTMLDTGKKNSDGTPVRQLKWHTSILDVVRHRLAS